MGVRELVGDANGVPASEKVKKHCSRRSEKFELKHSKPSHQMRQKSKISCPFRDTQTTACLQ